MAATSNVPQHLLQAIEVYTKGTKAWFEDDEEAWVSASVVSKQLTDSHVEIVFHNDLDERKHIFKSTLGLLQKNNGAELPPLRNPPKMENIDDLTSLSHLNEPSVLHTIRTRYLQKNIYTYSGIVLIATNPFDRVPLYEPDIIQQYSGRRRGELEPHLFAIAEDAYRCMIRENSNQTIVVSGESGAGKTVSAKYIMRYFATADDKETTGKAVKDGGMTEVEEQILATNPIMEAFGNAKTTRNDNSSRFGKYIEIQFDKQSNIVGAKIRTYLLERSRLIFQPDTERNYHIFYQLCAGAPSNERKELDLKDWTKFHYLNQSGTGTVPGVDDVEEFELTQRSLSKVGIAVQTQWQIFRLLASLLHIGNIEITGKNDAVLPEDNPSLITATGLLGIKTAEFRKWIIRRQIVTRSEKIVTQLNPTQANVVKDSVAKYIYASLFDWLVEVVNKSLSCQVIDNVSNFIGVLDIYGFEHFKKNSFEQFCINYANEKLQQQFNQHVFKLEQEEYVKEKIDWKFIDFSDNQRCIEMIEAKLGILSLLDEESRLPTGTDQGFCNKLFNNFGDSPTFKNYFKKPRFSNSAFIVVHYAHDVEYDAAGFIDKNKDTVPDELLALLQNADSPFLVDMLHVATAAAHSTQSVEAPKKINTSKKPTLGSIFKLSLISLMETIGKTNVHYIRCIKPNEAKVAWEFEPNMVLAQLRACGVLETIRISCAGYPSRWTFEDFAERYYALVNSKHWEPKQNPVINDLCRVILSSCIHDQDKYQVGLTKIFFRAGQLAYMEKLRADRWNQCAILLQKNMRRFILRLRYLRMKDLALRLQCVARKKVAKQALISTRLNNAAIIIQTEWRRYSTRKKYLAQKAGLVRLQAACRGWLARKNYKILHKYLAAILIQRMVRGWLARKQLREKRQYVTRIQSCVRRRRARKDLITLRSEARSATHLQQVSYKLENKVVELTTEMSEHKREKDKFREKTTQLELQVRTWMDKYEKLDAKSKQLEERIRAQAQTESELSNLKDVHEALQKDYREAQNKIKAREEEISNLKQDVEKRVQESSELRHLQTKPQNLTTPADEEEIAELKNQVSALKSQLTQTLRNPPRRQLSMNSYSRSRSPGDGQRNFSPDSRRDLSPNHMGGKLQRRRSVAPAPMILSDRIMSSEPLSIRPSSVDDVNGSMPSEADLQNPEEAIYRILQDHTLFDEVLQRLITNVEVPVPNPQKQLEKQDIIYPAHVIGICGMQMWRVGLLAESERFLFTAMHMIQEHCFQFSGELSILPCAYWLVNTHELLSLLHSEEQELERELSYNSMRGRRHVGWHDFEKLAAKVNFELRCLEENIYDHWMMEVKKKLTKMAVPAVVETQSLPGFIVNDTGRFFGKILSGSNQPAFSMDDMLNLLSHMHVTMRCFHIDPTIKEQSITELIKLIGTTAFNDLVMRRNFNSWKRAMQIQYNITRLEEWCKSHEMPDATLQLEHLMQAAKLLQLKKETSDDVKIIYDVCWLLSPIQVQKLIQSYHVADYEEPVPNDILRIVAMRVSGGDANDVLVLDTVTLDENPYERPELLQVEANSYVPSFLNLKRLKQLMVLIEKQRQIQRLRKDSI